jgi:hypothetical protein
MKIYDAIRLVNHILGCTPGQSLINYQLGPWPAMEPGSVRFWRDDTQRWRRTSPTMMALVNPPPPGDKMDTPQDTEELEDKYTEFASLPLLMLSLDQASSGWAAAHFLAAPQPGGMGLNVTFTADPFHR